MLVRICAIFVIAILLVSIYFSFRWMVADFYGERVTLSLEDWIESNTTPSDQSLQAHLEFADQSLAWAPSNPRYKELKARLLLFKAQQLTDVADRQVLLSVLQEMTELHRAATVERPRWPFSWANLAWAKGLQQDYDDEYRLAVRNAVRFGPYEVGALDRVVRSAVPVWTRLEAAEKQSVSEAIANGVQMSAAFARNVKPLLNDAGLLEEVCITITFHTEDSKKRLCG